LGDLDLGTAPIAFDAEDRAQRLGVTLGGQRCRRETFPEGFARHKRPRPEYVDLYLMTGHRSLLFIQR
jgi:hypothetical protein